MTKVGLDAIGTSTTLESNKSLPNKLSRPFLGPRQAPGVLADAQPSAVFLMAARVLISMSSV
jgi:hypothetical protein